MILMINRFISKSLLLFFTKGNINDGQLTVDGGMEGNQRLTAGQSQRLQLVVDNRQQVMVVDGIKFDEHIEVACGIMTLHNLRNVLEFRHDLIEGTWILEVQSDIGTGLIADLLRIDHEL